MTGGDGTMGPSYTHTANGRTWRLYGCAKHGCDRINPDYLSFGAGGRGYCLNHIPLRYRLRHHQLGDRGRLSPGVRYRLVRAVLVVLRRLSLRYMVNFDNAVESSAKDVCTRQGTAGDATANPGRSPHRPNRVFRA